MNNEENVNQNILLAVVLHGIPRLGRAFAAVERRAQPQPAGEDRAENRQEPQGEIQPMRAGEDPQSV